MNNFLHIKQLFHLTVAHAKEVSRQPAVLFWGVIFPILISLGLGAAFTRQTETVHNVAVIEESASIQSVTPIDRFLKTQAAKVPENRESGSEWQFFIKSPEMGDTRFIFHEMDWQSAVKELKRGKLGVIIERQNNEVSYHFDPMNPDAQLTFLKLSGMLSGRQASGIQTDKINPLTVTGTRYIDFLIPGLISMGVMMSCMWGISYGMIERRSKKLLRRMVATPMKKSHFLISLMAVRIGMNFAESTLLFLAAWLAFDISIQGSLPALLLLFTGGNIAFCGIAILASSRTANTEIGNGLINAVVMPMTVLSGVFFSYHNFPDWSIPFIKILPLTLLSDGLRSIFIEGAGLMEMAVPIFVLFGIGLVFFSAGLKIFRWH